MEDKTQKLYQTLYNKGLYTKTYDDFTAQFSDEVKKEKLFNSLNQKGLYTKTYEDFNNQFFTQKKKVLAEDYGLPSFDIPSKIGQEVSKKPLDESTTPQQPLPSAEKPKPTEAKKEMSAEDIFPKTITPTSILGADANKASYFEQKVTSFFDETQAEFTKEESDIISEYKKKAKGEGADPDALKEDVDKKLAALSEKKQKEFENKRDELIARRGYEVLAEKDIKNVEKMVDDIMSQDKTFEVKRKALDDLKSTLMRSVSTIAGDNYVKQFERELNDVIAQKSLYDEEGVNVFGWKMEAQQRLDDSKKYWDEADKEFRGKYPDFQERTYATPGGMSQTQGYSPSIEAEASPAKRKKFQEDYQQYKKDRQLLSISQEKLGNILKLPDNNKADLLTAFKVGGQDLLGAVSSAGWSDTARALELGAIGEKMKKGEELSYGERAIFDAKSIFDVAYGGVEGGDVGAQIAQMIPFIQSLMIPGMVGAKPIQATIKELLKKQGVGLITKKGIGTAAKEVGKLALTQAYRAPSYPMSQVRALEGMRGETMLTEDGGWNIDKETVEGFLEAAYKGTATGWSEAFTESISTLVGGGGLLKVLGKKLSIPPSLIREVERISKATRVGNVPSEVGEELFNIPLQAAVVGDQPLSEVSLDDVWETVWVTAATTSLLGIPAMGVGFMSYNDRMRDKQIVDLFGRDNIGKIRDAMVARDPVAWKKAIDNAMTNPVGSLEDAASARNRLYEYSKSLAIDEIAKKNKTIGEATKPTTTDKGTAVTEVGVQHGAITIPKETTKKVIPRNTTIEVDRSEIYVDGKSEGEVELMTDAGISKINWIDLKDKKGQGHGRDVYYTLRDQARASGNELISDDINSMYDASKRLWESLVKRGEAELIGNHYVFSDAPNKVEVAEKAAILDFIRTTEVIPDLNLPSAKLEQAYSDVVENGMSRKDFIDKYKEDADIVKPSTTFDELNDLSYAFDNFRQLGKNDQEILDFINKSVKFAEENKIDKKYGKLKDVTAAIQESFFGKTGGDIKEGAKDLSGKTAEVKGAEVTEPAQSKDSTKPLVTDKKVEEVQYFHGTKSGIKGEIKTTKGKASDKAQIGEIRGEDIFDGFFLTKDENYAKNYTGQDNPIIEKFTINPDAKILDATNVISQEVIGDNTLGRSALSTLPIPSEKFPFQDDFNNFVFDKLNKQRQKNKKPLLSRDEFNEKYASEFDPSSKDWNAEKLSTTYLADYVKEMGYDGVEFQKETIITNPQKITKQESVQKPAEVTEVEQTEAKEAITAPITKDQGKVPPTPQKPVKEAEMTSEGETRTREIGAKVIESANVKRDVKDALLENGIDYVPRGQKYTLSELQEIVDMFSTNEDGLDKLAQTVYDLKNDIKGDTRITLNVYIADKYSKLLDESKDPKEREKYRSKLADAFIFGQEFATEAGQTVEALKRWRELLSRDPESIIAIRKRQQSKTNEFALAGMEGDIKSAKEILDSIVNTEEFKQFVESEVNKEIDKIANKKYGEVDKKKINDFFDGLLVKNDKAFDATVGIPIAVYNGAVLGIKKAVLAGVDVTNAIKQAVDYIDAWYQKNYADGKISSPEWNRDDYMAQMDKQLQPLTRKVKKVKRKVSKKVEESLVDKIYAKMSTATKPQLRRLVREYITTLDAEGAISEQRFKDLFAQAIGLDVLTPENEQKIRETALSLKNATKAAEKLVAKFKELVDETDNTKLKQLEEEIKVLKKEANKAKFEAQKAARKLEGLMTDKATLGSTIHTIIQGNLLTPISLMSNVVGNTVFLPVRNASYMVASALDLVLSKMASVYTPVLNDPWVKANPRVRRLIESLPTPSREYDYFASVRGYWYGMPKGLEEGIRQMWTGTLPESEYQQYIGQGLNPWKAALRLRDQLTGKEQIAFDTAMANLLEAFPTTYMAEGFFRALNLGDKPYRRAAERSRLEEIASLKGLKGKQRDAFINNPDPDSVEEARKEGDVAVYQQDTVVSEMFSWLNKRINRVAAQKATKRTSVIISTVGALLKATQAPYVKTPVNLIGEAIDYSIPSLSLFRALYYAKEGNKRKSYEYFGKAAVGYMLMNITFFLIKEGLLSPPTDDDDKIRQAQYDAKPGYSLNIDALWRRIDPLDNAKGNSEWKDKDKIVNVQRLGVFSMILMGQSKAYSEFPPDEMMEDMNFIDKSGYGMRMIPSVVGASLDQSFLSGTASGIKAFTEGGPAFDRWVISTSKALSAVIYPNTLAQISQVFFDDNYIREVKDMYSRDEKFKKQIINTFKDRTFMGKDLPAKVTLWGEKVNRVPEGESWAHVMFDVTRSVEYQKSSFGVRMFEWWERYRFIDETEARKILPSIPSGSNTVGWDDRNMTAKEVEEFQMAVGQRRKSYVENTMNSVEWEEMSDEERIVELERIYRTQASKVKAGMFMLDVIKADPKVFNFLDENDLIPIPTKTATIKYQRQSTKLDPEQTAEYYSNVQRYFVERINNSGIADRELSEDERSKEKLIKQVNGHWDRAREVASKNWITSQRK